LKKELSVVGERDKKETLSPKERLLKSALPSLTELLSSRHLLMTLVSLLGIVAPIAGAQDLVHDGALDCASWLRIHDEYALSLSFRQLLKIFVLPLWA